MTSDRRRALLSLVLAVPILQPTRSASEPILNPLLEEANPDAVDVGYVRDAARVNPITNPTFVPGRSCKNCDLYRGQANDSTGPCKSFRGYRVFAIGWCSGYEVRCGPADKTTDC